MRLFTALAISPEVRTTLVELVGQLAPAAPFHWSPPENLHITTKFIGHHPPESLDELRRALREMNKLGPIDIRVRGLGWYPNPHSPRVLFAGIDTCPLLHELHRRTDSVCAALGIPPEPKPFNPHVTLARAKTLDGLREVRQAIAHLPGTDFGGYTARSFHLYESASGPGGSHYSKLEEFPLQ